MSSNYVVHAHTTFEIDDGLLQTLRRGLAWIGHAGNLADLATTFVAAAIGGREIGIVPAWLLHHGLPLAPTMLILKTAAALTLYGLWRMAALPDTGGVRTITRLVGLLGLATFAALFVWVTGNNLAVILSMVR